MPNNGVNSQFFPNSQMVKASYAESKTSNLADRPAQRKLLADEDPPVVIHAGEPASVVARPSKVPLKELVDSGDLGKLKTNFSNQLGKLDRRTASAQEKENLAASTMFCTDNEPALRTAIRNFGERLQAIEAAQPRDAAGKEIHYLGQLARHVDGTQRFPHVISHDMDIVTSEMLSFVMRKLLKHPDDSGHKELAVHVLQAFHENFGDYLKNSHTYAKVLPPGKTFAIAARQAVEAMLAGLSQQSVIPAIQAIRDAAQQILPMSKPPYNPFEPQGQWKNHHSHGLNNYHAGFISDGALPWQANQGKANSVDESVVMAIPHHVVTKPAAGQPVSKGADPATAIVNDETQDYLYYTDAVVHDTHFATYDETALKEWNKLDPALQNALVVAATGVEVSSSDEALAATRKAAFAYARNVTAARLAAGQVNVMVVFGELTGNKPNVPQEMLGAKRDTYVANVTAVQRAIFEAAHQGMLTALAARSKATNVRLQVRIVFHNDTEGDTVPEDQRRTATTSKLSERDIAAARGVNHERHHNISQPSISDIADYSRYIDAGLTEYLRKPLPGDIAGVVGLVGGAAVAFVSRLQAARSRCTFEPVLQLGHMMGVHVANWDDVAAMRTAGIQGFFQHTKDFKTLRVQTDTSWLTASARYVNFGMGQFLMTQDSPGLRSIGERLVRADRISNEGFMFMSAAERALQQRIIAGDNSTETLETMALVRACIEKVFQSYYGELGGIFDDLRAMPKIAIELADVVEADANKVAVSEGNFIGLLLAVYAMHQSSRQDNVPFVWGADDLTQHTERSGVDKFRLYRDQLAVESLMEMTATTLTRLGDPRSATWRDILDRLRMGPGRDAPFWPKSRQQMKISTEGVRDSHLYSDSRPQIKAATMPVAHGNKAVVTANDLPLPSRL